ncbi:MAG: hypothetical protein V4543_14070 [Bacteroidota bacterium]
MNFLGLILNSHSVEQTNTCETIDKLLLLFEKAKEVQPELKKIVCVPEEELSQLRASILNNCKKGVKRDSALRLIVGEPQLSLEEEDEMLEGYVTGVIRFPSINIESKCGLLAHVFNFPLISISNQDWENAELTALYSTGTLEAEDVTIRNIYSEQHVAFHSTFLRRMAPYNLPVTDIPPELKDINYRDDHGTDVLRLNESILKHCPYVKTIRSAQFKPNCSKFVNRHRAKGDGFYYAHLVLYRTDAGLSYLVQTTATNDYEADLITKELEKLYP